MRGVSNLSIRPGDYTIEAAEWRRDVNQQLSNLTSGSGPGDEPIWHVHNVERTDGSRVMEVFEDRRAMEGRFQTSGRQFLFKTPDGEPVMAYEREGHMVGTTATLEDVTTEEVLGSWKASGLLGLLLRGRWELVDPSGDTRARAKRSWSLGALQYPSFALTSEGDTDIGRLSMKRDGVFQRMDVTLEQSPIPTEILLAMSYGILWGLNQKSSSSGGGSID